MGELGTLERPGEGAPRLRFVRHLRHPRATVWRAISEPDGLAAWFPSTIDGERAPGAPLRFRFPPEVGVDPVPGEMLRYEPPGLIEFRWGGDIIRIELRERDDGTELTLLDTLEDIGKGARDAAGWHACLAGLEAHLDGDPARAKLADFSEVHQRYRQRFGSEASRLEPPGR